MPESKSFRPIVPPLRQLTNDAAVSLLKNGFNALDQLAKHGQAAARRYGVEISDETVAAGSHDLKKAIAGAIAGRKID
jgi:hypothetical protein